ncbi:hypothetical protein V8G54_023574 [Vigna mungo]|uniref:Uncharacterized protein n=1 Tax=Vigna mungo TaxID=3915 RepID=A0AAQ3N3X4_VIGMU
MYLKKPLWSETTEKGDGSATTEDDGVVSEVGKSLQQQRVYREVTLALRTGLRDARAEFSFLRVRALRSILKFLRSVAEAESTIDLFNQTQCVPQLQDKSLSNTFYLDFGSRKHSLKESGDDYNESKVGDLSHIFGVEPMKVTSPSTDAEVALALRVLEGCCLLHPESTILAHQNNAIQVLMNILSTRGVLEQGACLDALISLMVDSSSNQMDFEKCNGIIEVADLLRDKQVDENLRLKCGEFLLLLIGHVNGRDSPPLATIHEDTRRLLGEKSASLIWAASQFGSTLDPEQRLTALQIQARRVLESLDLLKCGEFLLLLTGHVNGRDSAPLASIHEDTRRLLGEKTGSLIWAASQFEPTLGPEERLTFLQNQARRVLESLDLD